ncbi:hypothetical protein [Snodgrassella alvi]|jgi:hypothetical protein|uniref:Uncharacterized protein n=1 Tax=Snodgrassella alvi TaxID=1196083 RepID=A0A855FY21_9NEIS|nr:hypothetical protein [Snodgrassella alvi]PIT11649.1 hypothetical protein BGI30_03995 [Snodgrassella alvi]PIT55293.1 hypothetical protein BHC59_11065 [Snodgrassella alvi]PIT62569.1 hypothetical protein BHC57_01155 [Snodgrassella alvi]
MNKNDQKTIGQALVGVDFNVSGSHEVTQVKQALAGVIDTLHGLPKGSTDLEFIVNTAIGSVITAQMWVVKALTYDKWVK